MLGCKWEPLFWRFPFPYALVIVLHPFSNHIQHIDLVADRSEVCAMVCQIFLSRPVLSCHPARIVNTAISNNGIQRKRTPRQSKTAASEYIPHDEKVACSSQVTSSIKTPGFVKIPGVFITFRNSINPPRLAMATIWLPERDFLFSGVFYQHGFQSTHGLAVSLL